jgi:hypothetical protein
MEEGSECSGHERNGRQGDSSEDHACPSPTHVGRSREFQFSVRGQFQPRVTDIAQPVPGVLLEAAPQQASNVRGRRLGEGGPVRMPFENRRNDISQRLACERHPTREHFLQDASERPYVGPLVDRLTARLLRAHVTGRTQKATFAGGTDGG